MNRFLGIVFFLALLVPSTASAQETTPPTPTGEAPAKKLEGESTQGQYIPLTGIPFITQDLTSEGCRDGGNPEECQTNLGTVFQGLIIFLIGVGGILAVAYFMWGAIQYMTQDIPSMKQNGREKMLGAVGGLVAVLAAFTLLQTIAPGIQTSIANFNEFLRPVATPDCVGTEQGCLEPQEEGAINAPITSNPTEDAPDIPPTSTGNGGETGIRAGGVKEGNGFLSVTKNVEGYSQEKIEALEARCKQEPDARIDRALAGTFATGPVKGSSSYNVHICFSAFEVKLGPPLQEEQRTYHPINKYDYIREYSSKYKLFAADCEKDWVAQYSKELAANNSTPKVVKGKVIAVRGVGEPFDPNLGKNTYYLQAVFVCSLTGF